ncbi:MAG: amidohydrolase family protein [Thermotogota bacterium]|nr:amidohydrolase family protein [Thermotogota bacterium]
MISELCLKNGSITDGTSCIKGDIHINGDKIVAITRAGEIDSEKYIDCDGLSVMPGFVDPHVHFQLDVGNYTSLDDFSSGSEAAVSGGVTTFIDFTQPVNRYSDIIKSIEERKMVAGNSRIDYSLHLTLAGDPDFTPEELIELAIREGLTSIKIFTAYGDSNRRTDDGYLSRLVELSGKKGVVIMIHAENDEMIKHNMNSAKSYLPKELPVIRNSKSEMLDAVKIATMAAESKGQCYMVHVSSGRTVEFLSEHFKETLNKYLFLETCPQYFSLNEESLSGDKGFLYTCCPPLRTETERKKIIKGLMEENIRSIGTDHCPFKVEEKKANKDDIKEIPFGIGSIGFTYSLFRTFVSKSAMDAAKTLSKTPAFLMGLYPNKGSLLPGSDADIVIVNPEKEWVVGKPVYGRSEYSPYEHMRLKGKVKFTILRGKIVFVGNKVTADEGYGGFLSRDRIFWR